MECNYHRPFVLCETSDRIFEIFFFKDTATPEIYTLSLHDALPIWDQRLVAGSERADADRVHVVLDRLARAFFRRLERSEEHTSELQSHVNLVCRLLLEKKNTEYLSFAKPQIEHITSIEVVNQLNQA